MLAASSSEPIKVYTIELNSEGNSLGDDNLIRLPSPSEPYYGVRFVLKSGTKASYKPKLKINLPKLK
jgi:hypothetical protein